MASASLVTRAAADVGADNRLDHEPNPVLDAAGEGLAEQLGVGERRARHAAVPELLGEDVGRADMRRASRGAGHASLGGIGCQSLNGLHAIFTKARRACPALTGDFTIDAPTPAGNRGVGPWTARRATSY